MEVYLGKDSDSDENDAFTMEEANRVANVLLGGSAGMPVYGYTGSLGDDDLR
ncbi:hypothetical protein DSCA_19610 [Desulfosarcina alkanivorans]|jgi:hypothetical protein|uniref:Uncharacterized protein n=1 Tax=Desulfosarcina alkanivorans TaxID=571177 RepID=A0A5K7YME5_9BACT|nr:hypothetical protein [Desulfosarcina alkanivorans]BBO68031.1 hypothetical protein DSCA_19610 [Desulfosarcina alkanivorans]